MGKTINLFMWGYQPHFRMFLESRAKQVIQSIAPTISPQALLVGIRTPEKENGHVVCVEPEDGCWNPDMFFNCFDRTEEIYKDHPDHNIIYGDEPRMRDKPENIRKKSVREAVREVLSSYDSEKNVCSYCGMPTRVSGYYVVPVLQLSKEQLFEYPFLGQAITYERHTSSLGLLDSLINCLLYKATEVLEKKEPGRFFDTFPIEDTSILRNAGSEFCDAITLSMKNFMFQRIYETLNKISSLPYEGAGAIGHMGFCPAKCNEINLQVELKNKVPLSNHKLARKIIEISSDNLCCVCQGGEMPGVNNGVVGFGTFESESLFRVEFVGTHKWDLFFGEKLMMQVAYGVPFLPLKRLDEGLFRSDIKRIITNISKEGEDRIWNVVMTAIEQKKGTMVVVSINAGEEAQRLIKQSLAIEPVELTAELVSRVSGIDGAILVDENCICHAIGVILDGTATDGGDPSRGARYNSAIRYITSNGSPTVCIVVSEDGHVNIMPKLCSKIDKTTIEEMIRLVKSSNKDEYNKALHWLDKNRFYLTSEQCDVVNVERERIEKDPLEVGEVRFVINQFVPNPKMDESYYN